MSLVIRAAVAGALVVSVSLGAALVARHGPDHGGTQLRLFTEAQTLASGRKVFLAAAAEQVPDPNVIGSLADHSGLRIEMKPVDLERARGMRAKYVEIAGMPVRLVKGLPYAPVPL